METGQSQEAHLIELATQQCGEFGKHLLRFRPLDEDCAIRILAVSRGHGASINGAISKRSHVWWSFHLLAHRIRRICRVPEPSWLARRGSARTGLLVAGLSPYPLPILPESTVWVEDEDAYGGHKSIGMPRLQYRMISEESILRVQ